MSEDSDYAKARNALAGIALPHAKSDVTKYTLNQSARSGHSAEARAKMASIKAPASVTEKAGVKHGDRVVLMRIKGTSENGSSRVTYGLVSQDQKTLLAHGDDAHELALFGASRGATVEHHANLMTGPRGGRYHLSASGAKVYDK